MTSRNEDYLLGDAAYATNALYDAAAQAGHQLLAPRKRPAGGLGHRRHSPRRLRVILQRNRPFGEQLIKLRDEIERRFG